MDRILKPEEMFVKDTGMLQGKGISHQVLTGAAGAEGSGATMVLDMPAGISVDAAIGDRKSVV